MKATVVRDKEYDTLTIVFDTPWTWRGYKPDNLSCWCTIGGHSACSASYVEEQTLPVVEKHGKALLERYIQRYSPEDSSAYEYVSREQFLNHVFEEA